MQRPSVTRRYALKLHTSSVGCGSRLTSGEPHAYLPSMLFKKMLNVNIYVKHVVFILGMKLRAFFTYITNARTLLWENAYSNLWAMSLMGKLVTKASLSKYFNSSRHRALNKPILQPSMAYSSDKCGSGKKDSDGSKSKGGEGYGNPCDPCDPWCCSPCPGDSPSAPEPSSAMYDVSFYFLFFSLFRDPKLVIGA